MNEKIPVRLQTPAEIQRNRKGYEVNYPMRKNGDSSADKFAYYDSIGFVNEIRFDIKIVVNDVARCCDHYG